MNERQRLYLVQARSDWKIFLLLHNANQPICHRLHYLQMCSEKLAKAYFWARPGAGSIGHAVFAKFLRSLGTNRNLTNHFGYAKVTNFHEWIKEVSELAYEIERLAPALAAEGPNPEYPWPRELPTHAPVEEDFRVWTQFNTPMGRDLYRLIEEILDHFERWF